MGPQNPDNPSPPARLEIGRWRVEPAAGELRDGEHVVHLRPKAMALLLVLAGQPGRVFAVPDLLATVWSDVVVSHASLSVLVVELRKALGDDPKRPEFIETIPRMGYRLIASVTRLERRHRFTRFALATAGSRVTLYEGPTIIGRDSEAGVRIDSSLVSRRHTRIDVSADTATITDLGSKNGTFLNGRRLAATEVLTPGDRITIGRRVADFRFVVADEQETVSEEAATQPPVR